MKSNVKIAYCTDFSANAAIAFESLLFNSWSFNIDIDVIHLVERDYQESLAKLNAFEIDLKHSLNNISEVKIHLFKEGEINALVEHLNASGYMGVVVGLQGNGKGDGLGSFIKTIYQEVNCNVTLVPMAHKIKIENKVLMAVELKNIRYLYFLLKAQAYLSFNFSKLTIVIRTLEELGLNEQNEIQNQVKEIFPILENKLIIHNPESYEGNLLEELLKENFDYCFVFKGDFFDKYLIETFEAHPDKSTIKEKVIRAAVNEGEIELAKNDSELLERIELRDF